MQTHQTKSGPGSNQFVTLESRDGIITIQPAGPRLSEREASIIKTEVMKELARHGGHPGCIVFDCSRLNLISSVGLMLFIEIRNLVREGGAPTVLYGLNDELLKLIQMVKVHRLFRIARNEKQLRKMTGGK